MKQITALFDGFAFSHSTSAYAIELALLSKAHLTGLFLDDFTYTGFKMSDLITGEGISDQRLTELIAKDKADRDQAVKTFEQECRKAGVSYSIHRPSYIALQEALKESVYTDLLIVDKKEAFTKERENMPSDFIRDLLSGTQCPVIVVPKKFKAVDKIVLLYDGEPSSVYASKLFVYLFPFLGQMDTHVLTIKKTGKTLELPDAKRMKEFIRRYYPKAQYKVLKGDAEQEITAFLKTRKQNELIVLGAYRRSTVSRWFRHSMADVLMNDLNVPLFIAHQA
jgi:nucleotide-binding universal stress UspA family protein